MLDIGGVVTVVWLDRFDGKLFVGKPFESEPLEGEPLEGEPFEGRPPGKLFEFKPVPLLVRGALL
jgi:hypothetical protein